MTVTTNTTENKRRTAAVPVSAFELRGLEWATTDGLDTAQATLARLVGLRAAGAVVWHAAFVARHWRYIACLLTVAGLGVWAGAGVWPWWLILAAMLPGVAASVWASYAPDGYTRWCSVPYRRLAGWLRVRLTWRVVCRECNLSDRKVKILKASGDVTKERVKWVHPKLRRIKTGPGTLCLVIRARRGQEVEELERAAEKVAGIYKAQAYRFTVDPRHPKTVARLDLVVRDRLGTAIEGTPDTAARFDRVRLGRTQTGGTWWLTIRSRHTLVAGCSGSGKGSIVWGVCVGLAPAVRAGTVRLWGIDLKRGVELATGRGLFYRLAITPADAIEVLEELLRVIDERAARMVGVTRDHMPIAGDPLHVLVIDELAKLIAYADIDTKRKASRLLAEILSQGRALGVVVLGFLQDPSKETVPMRNLFTQIIGLRLRSSDETGMIFDGMARHAPAHQISPVLQGTAWIIDDTGAVDRVRADYWTDEVIRAVAAGHGGGDGGVVAGGPSGSPLAPVPVAAEVTIIRNPDRVGGEAA
ncbi:MAG: FtsK/SpoIIIE domain-containing protein [Nocardioides sp.]